MLDFVLKKELPKENPYSVLGMSGAGRKGPAHIGVLVRLEEAVLKGEIPDFDIVLGKSSGAMVLAASESIIAERNANPYSGKSIEGAARQIEKILNENQDMYRMLSLWDMLWHPGLRGYVKKAPLKAFFRKIVGDKTFIDLPRLRIVVHNLNLNNDIIFGDVGLETKVADALDASIAVAGVIKDETYKREPLRDIEGKVIAAYGDRLVDGGTLRKSTIREVMAYDPPFAVDVYVGLPKDYNVDKIFAQNPNGSRYEALKALLNLKSKLARKISRDMDVLAVAEANREWHKYVEDALQFTGSSPEELAAGKKQDALVIMPQTGNFTLMGNGAPPGLVKNGYEAADKSLMMYKAERAKVSQGF